MTDKLRENEKINKQHVFCLQNQINHVRFSLQMK